MLGKLIAGNVEFNLFARSRAFKIEASLRFANVKYKLCSSALIFGIVRNVAVFAESVFVRREKLSCHTAYFSAGLEVNKSESGTGGKRYIKEIELYHYISVAYLVIIPFLKAHGIFTFYHFGIISEKVVLTIAGSCKVPVRHKKDGAFFYFGLFVHFIQNLLAL